MRISPRRLWGWEPETVTVYEYEGGKLIRSVTTTEPEYDKQQYEYLAALHEHEASLGSHGQPLDETLSPLADPFNPQGTHTYEYRAVRDWYMDALERAEKDPRYSGENYSKARVFRIAKTPR